MKPEPSPWRSLGHHEVLGADLEGDGAQWDEVFSPEFAEPVPDFLLDELPRSGWRAVRGLHDRPSVQIYAAPKEDRWVVATVMSDPGRLPKFMGDMRTYRLRPDQETRRRGLELTWKTLRIGVGDLIDLKVTLTNTSDAVWTPDPEDFRFVHAHFLDEDGSSPHRCHFAYSRSEGEWGDVSLAPGEAMELPVTFPHDEKPDPGYYGIEAILVAVNLRSSKATLRLDPNREP